MTPGRVGIVIPAYNCERYVTTCLHSAVQQDVPDLRVYVVDDASTDSTRSIIEHLANTYPTTIVWTSNRQNLGEAATRQAATEMALGDGCRYIAPLDADDVRKPNSLGLQVQALIDTPEAALCYGRTDIINAKGERHPNPWWEQMATALKGMPRGEVWPHIISRGKLGTMDTVVIRSDAAQDCRYDSSFRYFADVDYLAQLATASSKSDFLPVNHVVASYRFHARQSCHAGIGELPHLKYHSMRTITLRIFHRLRQQGRPVPVSRRRWLWRLLIARLCASAIRSLTKHELALRIRDFAMPISRMELHGKRCDFIPWESWGRRTDSDQWTTQTLSL